MDTASQPILVVDDEPCVCRLTARLLQRAGYTTLEARNGEEAVVVMQSRNGDVALVLSDIRMPRMDGLELAKILSRQFPAVRTVLMSAYSCDPLPVSKARFFLSKPFTPDSLMKMIDLALTGPAGAQRSAGCGTSTISLTESMQQHLLNHDPGQDVDRKLLAPIVGWSR